MSQLLQVYDSNNAHVGSFDGEFLYDLQGKMFLRVDGDEVYDLTIPAKYFGEFTGKSTKSVNGQSVFTLEE